MQSMIDIRQVETGELPAMLERLRQFKKLASFQEMAIFMFLTLRMKMTDDEANAILNMEPVNGCDNKKAA